LPPRRPASRGLLVPRLGRWQAGAVYFGLTPMLPFWISIAVLSLAQGAVVAAPSQHAVAALKRLRSPLWAVIPPASVVVFVFVARQALHPSAETLTYLALIAVPALAALALGWAVWTHPRGHLAAAILVVPLFALAWADRGGLAGEAAAVALSALSCVTLGVLLAAVTPARWLVAGIVLMAAADTALVVSELLQQPNDVLNAAHPAAGLPRLQSETFGSAVMGYGDLFVAGLLGGLLAAGRDRSRQLFGAALTAGLAVGFDLLFFAVQELPATVPVALATVMTVGSAGRGRGARRPYDEPGFMADPAESARALDGRLASGEPKARPRSAARPPVER
jgi:hypothetical protein